MIVGQLKLDLIPPEHVEGLKNNNWVHLHLFPVAMETQLFKDLSFHREPRRSVAYSTG